MYKVIIVEDEMLVRIGLRNSVEWSTFNMEVVADLSDGQLAWEYCSREGFPDLIITDIRMPKMDGMTLISNIRKQSTSTRIVVLSCLEEFELVRQAMSLGVSNYILKLTMTEEEITSVLQGMRLELDAYRGSARPQDKDQLLPVNMDLIKEKYTKDFLFYGIYSAEEYEQFAAQSGIRLSPVRMVVCTMEVDRYFELKMKFRDEQGHLIKMTMLNLLQEITTSYKRGEATFLDDTHYLLLFSFDDLVSEQSIMQDIHKILNAIQDVIHTYFNGSVSFGISGVQCGYKSLRKLYFESCRALENKFLSGPGQKHTTRESADLTPVLSRVEWIRQFPPLREILSPMKIKEYENRITAIESAITSGEKKTIRIVLYQFIQWVNTNLYDDHQNEKTLLFNITEILERSDTLPEMLVQVSEHIAKAVEQSRTHLHMSGEISRAIQFMKQYYDQNISLQQVADHVHLSPGYLSHLFKKELQITFIEYLNCYRIERAKELLTRTHLKSYDIAVKVGFSPEYTYFSKVFKKVTGLNPNEYRRLSLPGAGGEK